MTERMPSAARLWTFTIGFLVLYAPIEVWYSVPVFLRSGASLTSPGAQLC